MISTRRQEWRRATWPATSVAAAFHALIVSLACHGTTYAAEQAPVTLALVGGRIIDGFGGAPLENGVVLIAGNRIARVGSEASVAVPEGVRRIDVDGMSVLPGLWESHGHLMHIGEGDPDRFPSDFAAQAHDIMAAAARTNLLSGITTFRDTGGPLDEQMKLRAEINSGSLPGPRLFLAGPILRQIQPAPDRGSSREPKNPDWVATPEEARAAVRRLIARGVDQVKVYGFWDLPILQAVTSTAHAAGLGVDADALRGSRRSFARRCLDWTERRPHLAGALGAALLSRLLALGWVARLPETRAVRITHRGARELEGRLGILPQRGTGRARNGGAERRGPA